MMRKIEKKFDEFEEGLKQLNVEATMRKEIEEEIRKKMVDSKVKAGAELAAWFLKWNETVPKETLMGCMDALKYFIFKAQDKVENK